MNEQQTERFIADSELDCLEPVWMSESLDVTPGETVQVNWVMPDKSLVGSVRMRVVIMFEKGGNERHRVYAGSEKEQ